MKLLIYAFTLFILTACTRTGFNDDKYSFNQDEQGITITSDSISVRLSVYRDDIIQVRYFPGKTEINDEELFSVILKPDTNVRFRIKDNKDNLRIITRNLIAEVVKDPFNIHFYNRKGQPLLLGSREFSTERTSQTAFFCIQENDHFYGMGQKSIPVDRRGYAFESFNTHIGGYTRPYANMQLNIPYVYSPSGWGVFFDNTWPGYFDLGKTDPDEWYYTEEGVNYNYFFVQGDQPQDLLRKYFDLTGYFPMLPKWTLGLPQSKCAYENERQVFDVLDSFQKYNLPLDAIFFDVPKTWDSFKIQIPMLIGTSISGMPYFSSDIGGFTNTHDVRVGDKVLTTPELYTRWFEFGVFSPLLRPHSGEEQSCEPFAFDEMTRIITSSYLKLRYRLIPYLYSYMYRTSEAGEPLIKSLFFLFDDPKVAQYQDTEYMFGNEFLVAPVMEEGQVRKTIYLPQLEKGYGWIDYWTDELLKGGNEYSFKVPVQEIPLFIKQPAIIPMAKLKKYVDESPDDTLTIDIYPGGPAEFLLYEDDGITNNYQKGEYAITKLMTGMAGRDILVKIPAAEGNYPGLVEERTWLLVMHLVKGFDEILVNGNKISPVEYVRALNRNSYFYDVNSYMLVMDVGGSTGEGISVRVKKCTLIEQD